MEMDSHSPDSPEALGAACWLAYLPPPNKPGAAERAGAAY